MYTIFLMILRKIYKIGEKVSNFSTTLSLLVFYGWAGNSVTISTAFVNVMRGGVEFLLQRHAETRKAGLFSY